VDAHNPCKASKRILLSIAGVTLCMIPFCMGVWLDYIYNANMILAVLGFFGSLICCVLLGEHYKEIGKRWFGTEGNE